ncbi:MAG TPA: HAD-IA family hydrolase [Candidatus Saccharimonadales bacterium]|nr:HAD-IA family hydrolase [Candidatus Saccharimonadales bacterium]
MIELVGLDWDDVFTLGSTQGYYACYHEALVGVEANLDPEEENRRIRSKWGAGHAAQLQDLLREYPEKVSKAIELYEGHFFGDTFTNCLEVVPGSQQLVSDLAEDYKLAVATGGHPKILKERVLPRFNFPENIFSQIVTIYDLDDMSHAKPHPYMLNSILETQKVAPENAVFVGDAANDVLMARNAGVEPIVVLTGQLNREQAEDLQVRHIINDVTEIRTLLPRL